MEITKLPYFQRMVGDAANHQRFSDIVYKLAEHDSQAAGKLVQLLITTLNSVTQIVANYTQETPPEEATNAVRFKNALPLLLDRLYYNLSPNDNGLPWLILNVKFKRYLGNTRQLGRLREMMEFAESKSDSEVCVDWMCDQYQIEQCPECEKWEYTAKMSETYDDTNVCRRCIEYNYHFSEHYQRYVYNENGRWALMPGGGEEFVHEDDDDFHYDDDADRYVHNDWVPPEPPIIGTYHSSKNYHRIQTDSWSAMKHRWFGVELEVEIKDRAVEREDKAKLLNDVINGGERGNKVFFESDGSLNYGFEIITQPMSLPAQRDLWSWLKDRDATRHLLSHNTRTCGLHVHVNKDGLSQIQIAKMVTFVNDERNADLIRAIARRYAEGYCKIKAKTLETAHESSDRYEAVNVSGRKTIEFRIFKGSLKYESVVSAIEFCNALVEFSALPDTNNTDELNADKFIDFINNRHVEETTTLRPYLNAVLQTA